MPKLPFLKFFPNDWLAEPTIRVCSVAARGLWMDMLSLMHLSPRRGYLLAATGSPISPEQLARLTGCSADEVTRLLAELTSSGACSCTDDGTLYNRRMVREEGKREKCREAGRKGGGNPALKSNGRGGGEAATLGTFKGGSKGGDKGGSKGQPKPLEARGQNTVPSEQSGASPPEAGGEKTNPNHRPAVQAFVEMWQAKYGRNYAFARGKDADAVKWLLAQVGNDLDAFRAVVAAYLADGDKFVSGKAHDLGTLRSQANRWLVSATAARPVNQDEQILSFLRGQLRRGDITPEEYEARVREAGRVKRAAS